MTAMGQKIQIALNFNRKAEMSGTFDILIIFYKVLLRKHLMSSSTEKKWCNYSRILLRTSPLISATKTMPELA